MNIVKMQDSLKDLSDRQLMQTMQGGSAPQYLVLAEMQRRKKVREDSAQPQETSDRSVAEDIMSGIAAVPTRPMEMAEGGIVSFAEGGKTGRLKGEEEACWVDESTGEKYCPPDRPQMEMPRTGQRKTFQEGGMIPPDEMAEIEVQKRLQELQATDPNATEYQAIQSLMREGSSFIPPIYGDDSSEPAQAPAAPADEPSRYERIADQTREFFGGLFGSDEEPAAEPAPTPTTSDREPAYTPGGVPVPGREGWLYDPTRGPNNRGVFFNPEGNIQSPPTDPSFWEGTGTTLRRFREAARDQYGMQEGDPSGQIINSTGPLSAEERGVSRDEPQSSEGTNAFTTPPEQTTRQRELEPVREDGLMQLMRELQQERDRTQDESRRDAINQALIQTGLSMMASDNPDFLGALGEGGIQGLSAFASAQDAAAQRQGEISADMTDLMVAREANDIRRQAAQASAANAAVRANQGEINNLISLLEAEQKQLAEGFTAMEEEDQLAAQQRINALRQRINALMGGALGSGGGSAGVLDFGPDALVESQ